MRGMVQNPRIDRDFRYGNGILVANTYSNPSTTRQYVLRCVRAADPAAVSRAASLQFVFPDRYILDE